MEPMGTLHGGLCWVGAEPTSQPGKPAGRPQWLQNRLWFRVLGFKSKYPWDDRANRCASY